MRHTMQGLAAAVAGALILQVQAAGAQSAPATVIDVSGASGSALELALNGGKISDGTPDTDGNASLTVPLGADSRQRVTVWVDRCQDNKVVRVQLVVEGNDEPPVDEGCDRKLAGWFWSNAARVRLDVASGTVATPGRLSPRTLGLIGAAAGGVGVAALAAGGGSDSSTPQQTQNPPPSTTPPPFNPAGNYQSMTSVKSDPGNHRAFIELLSALLLIATTNSPLTIAGPAGSNWVSVTGDFDTSTNRFVLTGRGTVAGFPNVGVRFEGTITTAGALSGDYTMGTGGELPGGQAIVYTVTGQKQ